MLELIVYPVIFEVWKGRKLRAEPVSRHSNERGLAQGGFLRLSLHGRVRKGKEKTVKVVRAKLLFALALWMIPAWGLAQERPYDWGWRMHPMMWGGWGVGMMFMMVLFWGLVIAAVVLAVRWLIGQRGENRSDSALEILRQRYSRGEIDKEEFEARKKDLAS